MNCNSLFGEQSSSVCGCLLWHFLKCLPPPTKLCITQALGTRSVGPLPDSLVLLLAHQPQLFRRSFWITPPTLSFRSLVLAISSDYIALLLMLLTCFCYVHHTATSVKSFPTPTPTWTSCQALIPGGWFCPAKYSPWEFNADAPVGVPGSPLGFSWILWKRYLSFTVYFTRVFHALSPWNSYSHYLSLLSGTEETLQSWFLTVEALWFTCALKIPEPGRWPRQDDNANLMEMCFSYLKQPRWSPQKFGKTILS